MQLQVECPRREDRAVDPVIEAAQRRLRNSPYRDLHRLTCQYDRGELVLLGEVPNFFHKQMAQVAVAGLEGVKQVVNATEVRLHEGHAGNR